MTNEQTMTERLRAATEPVLTEVAPGRYTPKRTDGWLPDVILAELQRQPDGTYRLAPYNEKMARIDSTLLDLLGLSGQRDTLMRLGVAGFVEIVRVAPRTSLLNLNSYYGHLRRVSEDGAFWDPGRGNLEEYRRALEEAKHAPIL